jgi:hypothetical protein
MAILSTNNTAKSMDKIRIKVYILGYSGRKGCSAGDAGANCGRLFMERAWL